MKKLIIFLCFGIILFVFYGCSQEQKKNAQGEIPNDKSDVIGKNTDSTSLFESEECERTEGEMRIIRGALGAYSVDWGGYPSGGFERMKADLTPYYASYIAMTDGWGKKWIYFVSDDKANSYQHYTLISLGRNGVLNWDLKGEVYGDDIILNDGVFKSRCNQDKR